MIEQIKARLVDQCPSLKTVRGVGALAMLKPGADRAQVPAAYVHPHSDRGGPSRLVRGVDQRVERRYGVLLSLAVTDESRGESVLDQLDVLVGELRTGLVGWQPHQAADPITLDSGALRLTETGTLWWLEIYATAEHLRSI